MNAYRVEPGLAQHAGSARRHVGSTSRDCMFPSRTISMAINRPSDEVYAFLSNPRNLTRWTGGVLVGPLEQVGEHIWQTDYEGAKVNLEFTPPNALGVIDLAITAHGAPDQFYRTRVFPNGAGTELCCTILQRAHESDAEFQSNIEWLRADLLVLKSFIETQ